MGPPYKIACRGALVDYNICWADMRLVQVDVQRQAHRLLVHRHTAVRQFAVLTLWMVSGSVVHIEISLSGRYQGYGALHTGIALQK